MINGITTGLIAGIGLMLVLHGLRPRPAALSDALAGLYRPANEFETLDLDLTIPGATRTSNQTIAWLMNQPRIASLLRGIKPDLAILEQSEADYVAAALARIAITTGIGLILSVPALGLPFLVPLWAGIAFAIVLLIQQYTDVRSRATKRREDLLDVLSAFVDFVGLGVSFRPLEGSLFGAARSGRGWAFPMITAAMEDATRTKQSPVQGLTNLGSKIGSPELEELGMSLSYAGTDGAKIRESLRARSRSLRERIRAKAVADANAASEKITLPLTMFGMIAFLAFLLIPAAATLAGS